MTTHDQMLRLLNGYQVSQALHVAAVLKISDELADGGKTLAELASAVDCDERSLGRLLRALVVLGVYAEDAGRFETTELGDALRSDVPGTAHGWAVFLGEPSIWQAWGTLLHSIRTGENAFAALHGKPVWEYRAEHPEVLRVFDRAMTSLTGGVVDAVVGAYDFSRFTCAVDVGGGRGTLLAAVLSEHPKLHGVLFDQQQVIAGASEFLTDAGVADRVDVVGGSFFDEVPAGDCYLLKSILHDWEDDRAEQILAVCRRGLSDDGTVLVIEHVLDDPRWAVVTAMTDLNMLVGPGGRERTEAEYAALFEASGLRLQQVVRTDSPVAILEAVPA